MNKLLKFKEFSDLLESILYESKDKGLSEWKKRLVEIYFSTNPSGRWESYSTDPKRAGFPGNEIFRADFGSVGSRDRINNLLSLCKIDNLTTLGKEDNGKPVYLEEIFDWSGDYQCFRFKVESEKTLCSDELKGNQVKKLEPDNWYVIVNVGYNKKGESVTLGKKDLTPGSLNIPTGIDYDLETLANEKSGVIIQAINRETQNDPILGELLRNLVKICKNYTTSSQFDNIDKLAELETQPPKYSITYDFEEKFNQINQSTISAIKNNFGEVLGSIFMFSLFKDPGNGVKFPNEGNAKLIDFIFDGTGVSSKAGKMGGKASATGFCDKVVLANSEGRLENILGEESINDFYNKFILAISQPKTQNIPDKRGSSVFSVMFYHYSYAYPNSSTIFNIFKELSKLTIDFTKVTKEDCYAAITKIKTDEKLHQLMDSIKKISGNPNLKNKELKKLIQSNNENQAQKFYEDGNVSPENLFGVIMYYASKEFAEHINTNYSKEMNALLNKALSTKQLHLYLELDKDKMEFELKNMNLRQYELGGSNDSGSWENSKYVIFSKS